MSYEEARKDRKRSRRNAKVNGLLMALSQVGGMMARNQQQSKAMEQRQALEEWRYGKDMERDAFRADRYDARAAADREFRGQEQQEAREHRQQLADLGYSRDLERDTVKADRMDQRSERSRQTQLDVANIYSQKRSTNDNITGLEAETIGYDTPEIQQQKAQLQSVIESDDPAIGLDQKMSAVEQMKLLSGQARRAGMRQHMSKSAQPNITGGDDPESVRVPGQSSDQGFFGNVMQQMQNEGRRATIMGGQPVQGAGPMQSPVPQGTQGGAPMQQPAGSMPPAPGVGNRQQAQFGNIRDAMQRMLSGQGSPADEALINEFFGYAIQPGPQPPQMMPFQIPPGAMPQIPR